MLAVHVGLLLLQFSVCDANFLSLIGFIAPIPGVVFAIVREDLQYTVSDFPPILCIPKSRLLWFYSAMLPMDILFGVGISLLILILWLLHKVNLDLSSKLSVYMTVLVMCLFLFCSIR